MIRIALVGDYRADVPAHQAIPQALQLAAQSLDLPVDAQWLATDSLTATEQLACFDGIWCVPASPYRNMEGALLAIRHARERNLPFLGTCGGFQHAVIEYARNALGWADAEHAETAPDAARAVISPLACSLVEVKDKVALSPGSRLARIYEQAVIEEGYRCRYGINPAFAAELASGPLRSAAHDQNGEIRALELDNHPFFIATLFQPERQALQGTCPPLAAAFVAACCQNQMQPRKTL
ncbi:hypothetical protein BUE93_16865 [Chromobacterium amazonense]|uniref:CTP synthase (glutamine hydrolyzing) n=2 Tax=Chromobacterium amazonense TaxID=1382803 RepID=A0A2S9X153_9NEIS|nr:CTP synthase [Chromobacterium amazonense]PRP69451.1 hypothetical protein BUE93_16865 [Chromobacterium amazonense]